MTVPAEGDSPSPDTGGPVRMAAVAAAVVVIGLVVLLWTREGGTDFDGESPLINQVVPEVAGTTLDGEPFDIDQARGKWVLVNFFASWCVPCEQEHPELVEFAQRHPDDALVVSIPFGDREEEARAFFQRLGGDWPVVRDPEAEFAVKFAVLRPPETFLIAPSGFVVNRYKGRITADLLDRHIAQLLAAAEES